MFVESFKSRRVSIFETHIALDSSQKSPNFLDRREKLSVLDVFVVLAHRLECRLGHYRGFTRFLLLKGHFRKPPGLLFPFSRHTVEFFSGEDPGCFIVIPAFDVALKPSCILRCLGKLLTRRQDAIVKDKVRRHDANTATDTDVASNRHWELFQIILAVEPHNLCVKLFGLAFKHRLLRLVGEGQLKTVAIDDKYRKSLLNKNIPRRPVRNFLTLGWDVPLSPSLDSLAVLRKNMVDETFGAESSVIDNSALVVFPAVIVWRGGLFDRHDIHVLELVEKSLGSCREAKYVDVVVAFDEWNELFGDKLVELVGLIKPNLEYELLTPHRAAIKVLDDRRDVGNSLPIGTADDVADLTGSRDGPTDGGLIALGDTIIPR